MVRGQPIRDKRQRTAAARPNLQAGGHWFEPSTAHPRIAYRAYLLLRSEDSCGRVCRGCLGHRWLAGWGGRVRRLGGGRSADVGRRSSRRSSRAFAPARAARRGSGSRRLGCVGRMAFPCVCRDCPPHRRRRRRPGRPHLRLPAEAGRVSRPISTRPPTGSGGRCWTIAARFADGQIAEHGGELIDQGHTEIRQLAQELGLNLDNLLAAELNGTEPFYYFDGAPYSFAEATDDLKADLAAAAQGRLRGRATRPCTTHSTQRGLRARRTCRSPTGSTPTSPAGTSSKLGQLLDVAYNIEYGAETTCRARSTCSTCSATRARDSCGSSASRTRSTTCAAATTRFPARLAAALQGQIKTGYGADRDQAATPTARYPLDLPQRAPARARSRPTRWCWRCRSRSCASVDYWKAGFSPLKMHGDQGAGHGRQLQAARAVHQPPLERRWATTATPTRTPATRTPGR